MARTGSMRLLSRGCLAACVLVCLSCRASHPLKKAFTAAVLAKQPVVLDLPGTADTESVERFIRQHGPAALPLYQDVIRHSRHTTDGIEELELAAALEGLATIEGQAAAPLLRELVLDERVPESALDDALSALERISPQDAVSSAGERLLGERNPSVRRLLVLYLRDTRLPEGVPFLRRALDQEGDQKVHEQAELALRLLERPDVCQLTGKLLRNRPESGKWLCGYSCPGPLPEYVSYSEECQETTPLPQRAQGTQHQSQ